MTDYVYDLSDAERDALTEEFLSTKRVGCSRFACFAIESTDPFANIARQLEREVFEQSWGNDSVTMKNEFGPYDESSVFFMAVDTHDRVPAGVVRMIRNSPAGLKTIVDLDDGVKSPIAPIAIPVDEVMRHHGIDDLDRCWDGATAAIPRRYRRRLAATHVQILRVMALAAMRENIQHFVAVLDAPVVQSRTRRTRATASAVGRYAALHSHGRAGQPGRLRSRPDPAWAVATTKPQGEPEDSGLLRGEHTAERVRREMTW